MLMGSSTAKEEEEEEEFMDRVLGTRIVEMEGGKSVFGFKNLVCGGHK